jgi:4-hydroxy-tetrahydrodipicolinate reductase
MGLVREGKMRKIAVGVVGVGGRMGMMTLKVIIEDPLANIAGGVVRTGSPMVGVDLGTIAGGDQFGIQVTDQLLEVFSKSDVVIDFSLPDAGAKIIEAALTTSTPLVVGTTGLTKTQEQALMDTSKMIPLVYASNTSLGINLLFALVEQISRALPADFDIEVLDFHHNKKIDSPSGTALSLGHAAARGRDSNFDAVAKLSREGEVGRRKEGEIGFAALRGGNVIGEHSVIFAGAGERIEVAHKTSGREIYASGALRAAHWVYQQSCGFYTMRDVLGLPSII